MTDKVEKPSGLQTNLEQAANAFESLLTSEEEQPKAAEIDSQANETVEEEIVEDEVVEEQQLDSEDDDFEESETLEEEQVELEDQPETQLYALNVNGEQVEVTLDELQNGYSRQKDYTRKTQELAQQRKAIEQQQAELVQNENLYKELLPKLEASLNEGLGTEPDWEQLYANDPIGYVRERDLYNEKKEKLTAVQSEQQRLQHEAQASQNEQIQKYMEYGEQEILKSVPEWKDTKVATSQEIDQIYDYRLLKGLRNAWLYNKVNKQTKKTPTQKASVRNRVAKPGSVTNKKSSTPLKRSRQKLAKTGTVQDAAKVFEQLL